jgi:hypothetical protein
MPTKTNVFPFVNNDDNNSNNNYNETGTIFRLSIMCYVLVYMYAVGMFFMLVISSTASHNNGMKFQDHCLLHEV